MTYSKLKVERVKNNKTQDDLAIDAKVCRATISQIENGRVDNIQLGTLKKIAAALGSDIQTLFLSNES
jgi:putative transcriptional regulator